MRWRQPIWPRFLPTSMVLAAATLGPVGRIRRAPGTWGSVAGLLYFTVFFHPLGSFGTLVFSAVGIYFAVAMCGEAEFRLGQRDPAQVVLDEFVAMPVCFIGWRQLLDVAPPWAIFIAGFAVFRFFDVLKPLGIARLQSLPDGWGVVVDDVAAAVATCVTLHLMAMLWLRVGGG